MELFLPTPFWLASTSQAVKGTVTDVVVVFGAVVVVFVFVVVVGVKVADGGMGVKLVL